MVPFDGGVMVSRYFFLVTSVLIFKSVVTGEIRVGFSVLTSEPINVLENSYPVAGLTVTDNCVPSFTTIVPL